jgi:SAM-dependent methyltransferase
VLGVDIAAPLLALARSRATAAGLRNVVFLQGDATRTELPSGSFDAVLCVFGVFFASDMPAFVAEMWRLVRPGGTLAITTWGPDWGEPASSVFWECAGELQPSLFKAFNPWDEITTQQALAELFERAGAGRPSIEATHGQRHQLVHPDDFWDVALGSGYRATIDALSREQREALRERLLAVLRARGVTSLRSDVVVGIATRGDELNCSRRAPRAEGVPR